MKTNHYYKANYGRKNAFKEFFLTVFLELSSAPKLLLEVFSRKNFGERYFSLSLAIILTTVLAILPFGFGIFHPTSFYESPSFWKVISKNILWYLFLVGFFYKCIERRKEIKKSKSSFDFGKFSLYNGDIDRRFQRLKINGKLVDIRLVETLIEPGFFFTIGFALILFQQSLGLLLTISSIIYSLSYCAAYHIGDNSILDTIDQVICNEELVSFFVEGKDARETRGFRPYCRRPNNYSDRQTVADNFTEADTQDVDFEEVK